MWSGFSSEIETDDDSNVAANSGGVACGAASHLRLKPINSPVTQQLIKCRMWSGFSSEIETFHPHQA